MIMALLIIPAFCSEKEAVTFSFGITRYTNLGIFKPVTANQQPKGAYIVL